MNIGDKLDRLEDDTPQIISYYTINQNYTKELEGYEVEVYSWVEIPDQLWETATMMDYIGGIPMYQKRR